MSFDLHRSLPIVAFLLAIVPSPAQAQITLTLGNDTGTVLTPNGGAIDIFGGTTAGNNLFHSFQRFGVDANQTANFFANPSIQNILGRVVGGEASVINGIIKVNGGTNPNLYLMNPAGIIFGSGARLDVRGSFIATTANGIGFGTDKWFNAVGTNTYADLLGNPTSLAFTMSQPGAIVNAGTLSVSSGSTLVLAGGTVVSSAPIASQGGISIMAVSGSNLVRISQTGSILSLEIPVAIGSTQPAVLPSDFSILSLPQLLTGGSAGSAHGLTVDGGGQVTLTSSSVPVKTGDVVAKDIDAALSSDTALKRNISVFANSGVSLGAINRKVSQDTMLGTVRLTALTGSITVESILAGNEGIFIATPGIFRATSPTAVRRESLKLSDDLVIKDNPDLIDFLAAQGIPREQLINSTSTVSSAATAEGNVVARGPGSIIRIQHGGEATSSTLVNQGGSQNLLRVRVTTSPDTTNPVPFVTGGFDGFVSSSNVRNSFDPNRSAQFFTVERVFIRPNQFPEGVSGSAVGIYVGDTNSQLYGSLQSRPFVPPPIGIPPVVPLEPPVIENPIAINPTAIQQIQTSTTQTQTTQTQASTGDPAAGKTGGDPASTQRPQVDRTSNSSCTSTSTDKPSELGSRDRRPNPCTINPQDDAQILKILDEPLTPEQGKEIAPLPKQVSWWRLGNDR